MKITLNGQTIELKSALNITQLLEQQGYAGMLVAVAHNKAFVPKTQRDNIQLGEGDEIEIVAPMQGG